jgi:hypothetical protein
MPGAIVLGREWAGSLGMSGMRSSPASRRNPIFVRHLGGQRNATLLSHEILVQQGSLHAYHHTFHNSLGETLPRELVVPRPILSV